MHLLGAILTVLMLAVVVGDGSEKPDPYSLHILRFELKMQSTGLRVNTSFGGKRLARMGDGVAVGLIKIVGWDGMKDPERVKELLPIILKGFSEPRFIVKEDDKNPAVTLLLLDYLKQNTTDRNLLDRIEETRLAVQRASAR